MRYVKQRRIVGIILLGIMALFLLRINQAENTLVSAHPSSTITLDEQLVTEYEIPIDGTEVVEEELQIPSYTDYVQTDTYVYNLSKGQDDSENQIPFYGEKAPYLGNSFSYAFPTSDGGVIAMQDYSDWTSTNSSVNSTAELLKIDSLGNVIKRIWVPHTAPPMYGNGTPTTLNQDGFKVGTYKFAITTRMYDLLNGTFQVQFTGYNWNVYEMTVDENLTITSARTVVTNYASVMEGQEYLFYVDGKGNKVVIGDCWYSATELGNFIVIDRTTNQKRKLTRLSFADTGITPTTWRTRVGPNYLSTGTDYLSFHGFSNGGSSASVQALVVWDSTGAVVSKFGPIVGMQTYSGMQFQKDISDATNYYFIGVGSTSTDLIRYESTTRSFSVVKSYPVNTSITFKKDAGKTLIYGYTPTFTGEFFGYGTTASIFLGTVDDALNIESMSGLATSSPVSIVSICALPNGDYQIFGKTSDIRPDIVDAVTSRGWDSTGMWADGLKTGSFWGVLSLKKDNLLITGAKTGTLTDAASIAVYDNFDLNYSLDSKTQDWLNKRINRNPLDTEANIDWQKLGLDLSDAGPQLITYFCC